MDRFLLLAIFPMLVACSGAPLPGPDTGTSPGNGQKEIALPDRLLTYSYAGGTIRPIPNTPLGLVQAEQDGPPPGGSSGLRNTEPTALGIPEAAQ